MILIAVVAIPLVLTFLCAVVRRSRSAGIINAVGHGLVLAVCGYLAGHCAVSVEPVKLGNVLYVDSLSAFFLALISFVTTAAALYSIDYVAHEEEQGGHTAFKARWYYVLFNLFAASMFAVPMVNNLGLVWVAVEMTTLVSAFLVGFHNDKTSIEAAWKYIIICSVGIALALLGIILLYHTVSAQGHVRTLNWTDMMAVRHLLDHNSVKIAFLFLLVGFGTKAGLVPMHSWLPDAHSQAPAPVSALLSAVLLKTALYALIRCTAVVHGTLGNHYTQNLFMAFGVVSLGVAAGLILVQKDVKRLLAYSSVEHIGIIFLGLGFGGLGVLGALLHIVNHAVTKSLMFFCAGSVVQRYKTNNMNIIHGVLSLMPLTGSITILGAFALAGSPPFSIFISELVIVLGGFQQGHFAMTIAALIFMAVAFAGLITHFSGIVFGKKPEQERRVPEGLCTRVSYGVLFVAMCVFGFWIPAAMYTVISSAAGIIQGM